MKLIHIRVPGRNSVERLTSIRESYLAGTLNVERLMCVGLDIDGTEEFWIGARYAHPNRKADDSISDLAESVNDMVLECIRVGVKEYVIVTDARFVVIVADNRGAVTSSDDREAKARANSSIFERSMWDVHTFWRIKSWSRPRVVIYDYDGNDGRKVWSWVFHCGPWWFIRERYAL